MSAPGRRWPAARAPPRQLPGGRVIALLHIWLKRIHDLHRRRRTSLASRVTSKVIDQSQHRIRIHERYPGATGSIDSHHHVAGQQGTDSKIGNEGLTRELRIARDENLVGPHVLAQLLLQRVAATSIALSTPKPSFESSLVTLATAASKASAVDLPNVQLLMFISSGW